MNLFSKRGSLVPLLSFLLMAQTKPDPAPVVSGNLENGKKVFMTTCFACHGTNGKGAIPGIPDFTKTPQRLAQPDSVLLDHVIHGFQSPGGLMPMPPRGGNPNLSDEEIFDAILYIRKAFGPDPE